MRIAVLAYGRLDRCAVHYNNIIEQIGLQNDIDFFLSSDNPSESLLNDFISLYKPILYNKDAIQYDYDLSKYPAAVAGTNFHNMTCHFINKNRVYLLLEQYICQTNIQYDAVVSLRLDLYFLNCFDFNNMLDNTIYIPYGYDYLDSAINDQIAYGKVDVMKKYNLINPLKIVKMGISSCHPESLTLANIYLNKLNIQRVDLLYYFDK
jgi:hypothetical protein